MRLAIVNYEWDGPDRDPAAFLERHAALSGWAGALRAAGCDPVVVCQRFPVKADLTRSGVIYRFRPDSGRPRPGLMFAGADALHGSAAAARPDVAHVNGVLHPALLSRLRKKLARRAAVVVQDHGVDPAALSQARRLAVRRGLAAADLLLVAAHAQVAAWRECGVAPETLAAAPVPDASTDLVPVPRDAARHLSGLDGSPALLWVGGLTPENDPLTVVRGFALAAGRLPTARLTMVYGAADLEAEVRAEIDRSPALSARVRLIGAVERQALPAYYSAADFFVLGGRPPEGDLPVLEAMACGAVPVVADVPGFRALSGSERVGALWKAGHPQACAEALARAAARPLASEREAVRARFEKSFSWKAIGWQATEVYGRAVAGRRR
jgi:glycosyltransferase involved in cell wall biosynthesis